MVAPMSGRLPSRLLAALFGLITLLHASAEETKVAVVRVSAIYQGLESTQSSQAAFKAERDAIYQDARLAAYQTVLKELETVRNQLANAKGLDAEARGRIEREHAVKRQEALTLQREFENFRTAQLKQVNARMVERMESSLARIHEVARRVGEQMGYDWVIDATGKTNTGLPFMLYAKDPADITDAVVAELGGTAAGTTTTASGNPR